jgi:Co/Zn/Cd efflux system component
VALVKDLLILGAAIGVAAQIVWRLGHPALPIFETMGAAGAANLIANAFCFWLLHPHRLGDVNLASACEYSRNDIYEGCAVLFAALAVALFGSGWPDLLIAAGLLFLFLRSAVRVLNAAWREVGPSGCSAAPAPR